MDNLATQTTVKIMAAGEDHISYFRYRFEHWYTVAVVACRERHTSSWSRKTIRLMIRVAKKYRQIYKGSSALSTLILHHPVLWRASN